MRARGVWRGVLLACGLIAALPLVAITINTASAQAPEAETEGETEDESQAREMEARRVFRLGQAHYEAGEFAQAAQYFDRAYHLSGRPQLLFNAYVAYRDAQDLPNAAIKLREYLDENDDIPPLQRSQLSARLEAMDRMVAQMQANGETTADVETSDPDEAADETADEAVADASVGDSMGTSTADEGGFGGAQIGFVVGGVGGVMLIGGVVTGIMAKREANRLSRGCDGLSCPDDPALRSAASRGRTLALTTDILLISGGVALATGVTLALILGRSGSDDEDEEASVTAGAMCDATGCFGSVATTF